MMTRMLQCLNYRFYARRAARAPGMALWIMLVGVLALHANAASASCAAPANPIEAENCQPGTDYHQWLLDGVGDTTIQGYATDSSVNVGQTINFKINTTARAYTVGIFRLGSYGGFGARKITTINPSAALPQVQPACVTDAATNLYDCGTWAVSASWAVPSTAVSGVYLAILTRTDTGGMSQIVFVVRNDASHAAMVFRTADASWQAYNPYGGHSFYGPDSTFDLTNRAYKVSYNRPYATLNLENQTWISYAESPMIEWLEANGYDVTYIASVDAARSGTLLQNHKVFLSVGHDEYVSGPERTSIEAARDKGVNLAFLTGNEFFWKTRWENSIDGSGTPYRTLVCYKETLSASSVPVAVAAVDPLDPPTWTGTWRDATKSPPADGGRPENALTGQLFRVNGPGLDNNNLSIQIPAAQGKMRFWRNTQVANQSAGQVWTLPAGTLGYEWDAEEDNGFRPAGEFDLSTATYNLTSDYLRDAGGVYGAGTATHHLSLYRAPSGALVFGAGTVQWSWGLGNGPLAADVNMEQATVNLFADMGVQPATLQPGLMAATASTDHSPPTSFITSPAPGAAAHVGTAITVTGTAVDAGGGLVAGVEVSLDGGATWHPATGTSSWSYVWTPTTTGAATIESRAVDDSANLETPSSTVTVNVAGPSCPCGLFTSQTPIGTSLTDNTSYELGMKFLVDRPGKVSAIRYYKATNETGTHTGRIWSASGALLASVTFTGETASGWQQQALTTPLTLNAYTVYVVSVNANSFYVGTGNGLASAVQYADQSSVADGANGVYGSPGAFPTQSYQNTNYFRDVDFNANAVPAVVKFSGDGQSAFSGTTLPNRLVVRVIDASGTALAGQTVTFAVTAGGGTVTPASAVTDSSGQASASLTLGPGPVTNSVTATVSGVGSATFNATGRQATVFSTQTPATPNATDGVPYELGMKFQSSAPGMITAVRFYKAASETGTHVGNIWSTSGTLLASATFTSETPSGWQQQVLSTPLPIAQNTTYVVSVNINAYYAATTNGCATSLSNFTLSSVADGANGVYGTAGTFPTQSFKNTNYFRDVSFQQSSVVVKASGDNQVGLPKAALANPLVVTLLNSTGAPVAGATVSFTVTTGGGTVSPVNAVTNSSGQASAVLTLGAAPGTNTVQASAAGVGTATFTATGQAATVFTNQVPALPNNTDNASYELGMKFQSSAAGQIMFIRYYKAASETGTHTGTIWSSSGVPLAQVTFSAETASGWQVQALPTPLSIQANTTYGVSVNVNAYYVATNSGLASSSVSGPLKSVADGANGVFGSAATYPTRSFQNSNYFRDVGFVPQ